MLRRHYDVSTGTSIKKTNLRRRNDVPSGTSVRLTNLTLRRDLSTRTKMRLRSMRRRSMVLPGICARYFLYLVFDIFPVYYKWEWFREFTLANI